MKNTQEELEEIAENWSISDEDIADDSDNDLCYHPNDGDSSSTDDNVYPRNANLLARVVPPICSVDRDLSPSSSKDNNSETPNNDDQPLWDSPKRNQPKLKQFTRQAVCAGQTR